MKELSLHILDVAENAISAGADLVRIEVIEKRRANRLYLRIADNGCGIAPEQIDRVADPFYTSSTTRRVGLGLSLLDAAARRCDGYMRIRSAIAKGSEVFAEFVHDHIDRAPLGDMEATVTSLIMGNPAVEFEYRHELDEEDLEIHTRDVREAFGGLPVNDPRVLRHLMEILRSEEERLMQGA